MELKHEILRFQQADLTFYQNKQMLSLILNGIF
jgi:hypothetical protein